jgi:hypothetical protein
VVSEEEHIFLPLLWDIANLNVFLKSSVKIFEFSFESSTLFGVLEAM